MIITVILTIIIGIFLVIGLIISLNFGMKLIRRSMVKSSGQQATAIICGKQYGRWVTYSRLEHMEGVSDRQVILKLEVHPIAGVPYIAYDKFMAKRDDVSRLNEGCLIQVYIDSRNPQNIVCDPKTVTTSTETLSKYGVGIDGADSVRADIVMADIANQVALGGDVPSTQQVLNALKPRDIHLTTQEHSEITPDNPKSMF
jgi:hypothetical protein